MQRPPPSPRQPLTFPCQLLGVPIPSGEGGRVVVVSKSTETHKPCQTAVGRRGVGGQAQGQGSWLAERWGTPSAKAITPTSPEEQLDGTPQLGGASALGRRLRRGPGLEPREGGAKAGREGEEERGLLPFS